MTGNPWIRAVDLISTQWDWVGADDTMASAIAAMGEGTLEALLVREGEGEQEAIGILTRRDVVAFLATEEAGEDTTVRRHMGSPVIGLLPDDDLLSAQMLMIRHRIRHVVVRAEQGKVHGVLTEAGLAQGLGSRGQGGGIRIQEVMSHHNLIVLEEEVPLLQAIETMAQCRISCIPVVRQGKAVGVLTERDVVRLFPQREALQTTPLKEVMTTPLITLDAQALLVDAVDLMERKGIRRFPVVDPNRGLVGLVTQHDVVRGLMRGYLAHLRQVTEGHRRDWEQIQPRLDEYRMLEQMVAGADAVGMAAVGPEGLLTYVNAAALSILGVDRGDLERRDWRRIPPGSGIVTAEWQQAMQEAEQGHPQLLCWHSKPGHMVEGRLSRLEEGDRAGVGWTLVLRDQTEAFRDRLQLQQERDRAQRYLDVAGVILMALDRRGRVTMINRKGCEILGRDEGQIVGQDWFAVGLPEAERKPTRQIFDQLMAGEEEGAEYHENEVLHQGGDPRMIAWHNTLLRDEHGTIEGVLCSGEDITERQRTEQALKHSESRYRTLVDNLPQRIFHKDRQSRFVSCNRRLAEDFGMTPEEVIGRTDYDFVPPDLAAQYQADDQRVMAAGKMTELEERYWDGEQERFIHTVKTPLRDESGEVTGILGIFWDITEQKRAEEEMQLAATVFRSTGEAVVITDPAFTITDVNPAFTQITGRERESVIGQPIGTIYSGQQTPAQYERLEQAIREDGHWQGQLWARRQNGEQYPVWLQVSTVRDAQGAPRHHVGVFSDITPIHESQARIDFLAHHDPLTELPNRLLFDARLEHAIERARRHDNAVALLFLDLDRFKTINDSLGHPVGDRLLQAVAKRLGPLIREEDTLSRWGGDEFMVVLEEIAHPHEAAQVAGKILDHFAQPFRIDNRDLYLTGSIGISLFPEDGADVATLLKHADAAMYRAKESGRNAFQFHTPDQAAETFERFVLESSLRRGLERKEFEVHYQPQVDFETGRLLGAEALVRWRHPELGLLAPGRFIPTAEETGVIKPLGLWILETSMAQWCRWAEEGFEAGQLAVNLSGAQLQRGDLLSELATLFARYPFDPGLLEVELTETFFLKESQRAAEVLTALREMGVSVAIDDFGTGFSSLSQLKRLPIDRLKIDRSFVVGLPEDEDDQAIARAVIALARALRIEVRAEGVERIEQQQWLLAEGCREGQGFLLDPPLDAETFQKRYGGLRAVMS